MLVADFTIGYETVTIYGLTQWDKGQKLQIAGIENLPAVFQVHFANYTLAEAIIILGNTTDGVGVVDIPNSLLEQGVDFKAYVYVHDADSSETIKTIQLPVVRREKPSDFISAGNENQIILEQVLTDIQTEVATKASQIDFNILSEQVGVNTQDILDIPNQTYITEKANEVALIAEEQARLTEVAVERARIDSFTNLDAELIDGRVGADGITYSNIGGAIRSQIRNYSYGAIKSFTWKQGTWNSGGIDGRSTVISIASLFYFNNNTVATINIPSGCQLLCSVFNDSNATTRLSIVFITGNTYTFNANTYYGISLQYNPLANIVPSNAIDGIISLPLIIPVIDNINGVLGGALSKIAKLDKKTGGIELTQEFGYIDNAGVLRKASSGVNKYVEFTNVSPNSVIVYSGNYPAATWCMVYGYYDNGTIVRLLEGRNGGYDNQIITVTDPNITTIRAWSDSSNKILKCHYYSFIDILNDINSLNISVSNCIKDASTITVDINGGGDFTDINSAITYAKNTFDEVNIPITIFIKNGVYTLTHSSYWPWSVIDIKANRISLIGESRDGVKLILTNTSTLQNRIIDVGGECTIANLSIYCLNDGTYTTANDLGHSCYGIHNDSGFDNATEYKTTIENVYVYSECHAPIGAGLRNNQKQIYRNIETVANGIYGSGFYVHAPAISTDSNCSVVVDGVTAITKNGNRAIDLGNVVGSLEYTSILTTIRRSIFVTNGVTKGSEGFKTSHALTSDSALNNISDLNY